MRNLKRRKNFDDFGTESLASFMNLSLIQRRAALRIPPYLQGLTKLHLVNSSLLLLWSHPWLLPPIFEFWRVGNSFILFRFNRHLKNVGSHFITASLLAVHFVSRTFSNSLKSPFFLHHPFRINSSSCGVNASIQFDALSLCCLSKLINFVLKSDATAT